MSQYLVSLSPCVGLEVVAQLTFLLKDCYPQLVLNQRCCEILPPKKVDFSSILCSYLARFSASALETFSLKNFLHFFLKKFQLLSTLFSLSPRNVFPKKFLTFFPKKPALKKFLIFSQKNL